MISGELEAMILRLYHAEKWRIGTIATQVGVHHSTVRRVLPLVPDPSNLLKSRRFFDHTRAGRA